MSPNRNYTILRLGAFLYCPHRLGQFRLQRLFISFASASSRGKRNAGAPVPRRTGGRCTRPASARGPAHDSAGKSAKYGAESRGLPRQAMQPPPSSHLPCRCGPEQFNMALLRGKRNGALHRFEAAAEPLIILLSKPIQVDIHCIDKRQEFPERLFTEIAVRDKHGF